MQVLNLTQDQINSLPPAEREQIQQLVRTTLIVHIMFKVKLTVLQRKQFGIAV